MFTNALSIFGEPNTFNSYSFVQHHEFCHTSNDLGSFWCCKRHISQNDGNIPEPERKKREREEIRTKITDNIEHETNTNHKIYSIEREVHGMVKMSLQVRYKKWTHQEVVFVLASRSRASLLFDNDRTKNVRYIRNDLNKLYCHKALWKLEAKAAQFFFRGILFTYWIYARERERERKGERTTAATVRYR